MEWSSIAEAVRVGAPAVTATTAVLAYKMGREYFNRGQTNILTLEHYKRELDALLVVQANFCEMKRLVDGLLKDEGKSPEQVESLLRQIADSHGKVSSSSHDAMFIGRMADIRSAYYAWYDTWFVNAEDDPSLMSLADSQARTKTLARIKDQITNKIADLIKDLETLKAELKPDVKIEST